jgi:hypothetical protein
MGEERGTRESTAGLSAERIARNEAIFRRENDKIREAAERFDVDMRVPFICECADPSCRKILPLTLQEYRAVRSDARHFINAPGHEAAAQGWGEVGARFDGYVTEEKVAVAGEIAEQLEHEPDPATAPVDVGADDAGTVG